MSQTELQNLIQQTKGMWDAGGPANESDLLRIISKFGEGIPQDYLDFLRLTNGAEGKLPVNPWWFVIWAAETVIERWNAYRMEESIPGYMAFGSNAGDEMFVFNLTDKAPKPVYIMPFIGKEPGAEIKVANDFVSFVQLFGKSES